MNPAQEKIKQIASSLLGTPYKYAVQDQDIPSFLDCSSFTQYVYKQIGNELPRSTIMQATIGKEISLSATLEIGDLLFYRGEKGHYNDSLFPGKQVYIGHAALYIGNNKAIHAAGTQGKVVEENLEAIANPQRGPIVMIKRIIN